jgi:hypothetical protein
MQAPVGDGADEGGLIEADDMGVGAVAPGC